MLSCLSCRDRHLKCDKQKPDCGRCRNDSLKCVWIGRTRASPRRKGGFAKNQVWLPVPPQVDFVFEHTHAQGEDLALSTDDILPNSISVVSNHLVSDAVRAEDHDLPRSWSRSSSALPATPTRAQRSTQMPILRTGKNFLASEQEAILFTHYINYLAAYFDVGDIHHTFATIVQQRARENHTLLNAIFALSARHLSRTSEFDALVSDQYFQACLHSLIPALDDSNAVADDAIFAAAVLLRFLEEIEVGSHGSDQQGHRLGTKAIISTLQSRSAVEIDTLRRACYWSAYRQEFSVCLMNQRSMEWVIPQSLQISIPADDFEWVLLAVQNCAEILEYCFGEKAVQSKDRFSLLLNQVERWQRDVPSTFDPLYTRSRTIDKTLPERSTPQVFLSSSNSSIGHAYNKLGHALLFAYAPLPKLGPLRQHETSRVDEAITQDIHHLCGIAFANPQVPCAVLLACMGTVLFGDRFSTRYEQSMLRKLLTEAEKTHGWPTAHSLHQLEAVWALK